jgi:hypothetical protein
MQQIDPTWIWIALGVLALIIVAAMIARGARRSRTESLRQKFGNEYDHAVGEAGSRKRAEQELLARAEQVKKYNITPLSAADQQRFRADWVKVEQRFIERPTTAVVEADELVAEIMRTRGYPMGDFERHAADLSVTHPSIVEHYRAGHRAIADTKSAPSTEDMRQAMLHYRALFDELIDDRIGNDVTTDVPRATDTARSTDDAAAPKAHERVAAVEQDRDRDFK